MPGGEFKLPPRKYNTAKSPSASSANSESAERSPASSFENEESPNPTKAQRARLDEKGAKNLLVKLKMGCGANKMGEIEGKSDIWRAQMGASGAKIGKRGWERMDDSEPPAVKKGKINKKGNGSKNGEGGDVETFVP